MCVQREQGCLEKLTVWMVVSCVDGFLWILGKGRAGFLSVSVYGSGVSNGGLVDTFHVQEGGVKWVEDGSEVNAVCTKFEDGISCKIEVVVTGVFS